MATEITVTGIVKYETIVSIYDSFTARRIRVTDRAGHITEFAMYHTDDDPFEHKPTETVDRREAKRSIFNEDEQATL